jgi:hypothetical protein
MAGHPEACAAPGLNKNKGKEQRIMQETIKQQISTLRLMEPQIHRNIIMLPLQAGANGSPDYVTLAEASGSGVLQVMEVSKGGTVPELLVVNSGGQAVLMLDGEELARSQAEPGVEHKHPAARTVGDEDPSFLHRAGPVGLQQCAFRAGGCGDGNEAQVKQEPVGDGVPDGRTGLPVGSG